jgi:hypothetical protein
MDDQTTVLALESPRWAELRTRRGPGAEWVRDFLVTASDGSLGPDAFSEMWPEICSEATTYDAAYAAAPYLTTIAGSLPVLRSIEYLIVLGLIETYASDVPPDLEAGYRGALLDAQALAFARLPDCPVDHSLRYLLAAVAAFRGRADLASVLQDMDAVQEACPSCGTSVFPVELQRVVERDQNLG